MLNSHAAAGGARLPCVVSAARRSDPFSRSISSSITSCRFAAAASIRGGHPAPSNAMTSAPALAAGFGRSADHGMTVCIAEQQVLCPSRHINPLCAGALALSRSIRLPWMPSCGAANSGRAAAVREAKQAAFWWVQSRSGRLSCRCDLMRAGTTLQTGASTCHTGHTGTGSGLGRTIPQ